ncbi:MAG: NADH-quinone oxidoreductase subunit NuoE [bacterium]
MSSLQAILEEARNKPGTLIPVLQRAQEALGYLSPETLRDIARGLDIPMSDIYGVVTFYAQFRLKPSGKNIVKVCHGTACHVGGSERLSEALEDELKIRHGETTPDGKFTLERVACLGCCSLAPCIMINGETYGRLSPEKARQIVRGI